MKQTAAACIGELANGTKLEIKVVCGLHQQQKRKTQLGLDGPGGNTASGTAVLQHRIGEHFNAELGYARLHQNYNGIALVSTAPDSDRVYISVSYQLTRPLGR